MEHKENCMCDSCINARTRAKVIQRGLDKAQAEYEQRRGAPIGTVSVNQALRNRKP